MVVDSAKRGKANLRPDDQTVARTSVPAPQRTMLVVGQSYASGHCPRLVRPLRGVASALLGSQLEALFFCLTAASNWSPFARTVGIRKQRRERCALIGRKRDAGP